VTPEFPRPERVDTIGPREREIAVEANADERERLARRFGLLSLDRLEAAFRVRREQAGIKVSGQPCSASGEPVPAHIDEAVDLLFVDPGSAATDEVELTADALDTIEIQNGVVDLGEAAAETVALALDPFPRAPNAAEVLRNAGVLSEEEAGPMSGLAAALKDKLGGR
jgi:hypothetical protein